MICADSEVLAKWKRCAYCGRADSHRNFIRHIRARHTNKHSTKARRLLPLGFGEWCRKGYWAASRVEERKRYATMLDRGKEPCKDVGSFFAII